MQRPFLKPDAPRAVVLRLQPEHAAEIAHNAATALMGLMSPHANAVPWRDLSDAERAAVTAEARRQLAGDMTNGTAYPPCELFVATIEALRSVTIHERTMNHDCISAD